jgi:peptidoglycan-associated lipoprotein
MKDFNMANLKYILLISSILALAACTSSDTLPDPDPAYDAGAQDGATTGDYDDGSLGDEGPLDPMGNREELASVIYFDFDSSEVRAADTDTVAGHAQMMSGNMQINVRLEGHADERGSREYNIGLGERRSQAVRRLLLLQGVSAGQISTVSFGEERPAAIGSSESAYSQNRRVEITYTN